MIIYPKSQETPHASLLEIIDYKIFNS